MTIKGLTDQTASFPRIGELRKGEEKPKDGNRPGKDLTYFRFTSDDALARQMFTEAYPDQESLRNIHVFMPHKTADENMEAWIEKWVAGGLVYRSDGETLVLWRTDKGSYSLEPKPDPYAELDANGKRKDGAMQVGRMSVIVPELGRFATVTILTTSKHDIMNLTRQLRSYEALRGDLRGIPFVVKRRPYKISTPGQGGKRERREKWLLSIETQPQWAMAQLGMMERSALPGGATVELPSGEYAAIPANIPEPMEIDSIDDTPPWYDEPDQKEAQGEFNALDDLLFQLHIDFGLGEVAAKSKIKELGFTTLPKGNGELKRRLQDIYAAVKADVASNPVKADTPTTNQPELMIVQPPVIYP